MYLIQIITILWDLWESQNARRFSLLMCPTFREGGDDKATGVSYLSEDDLDT